MIISCQNSGTIPIITTFHSSSEIFSAIDLHLVLRSYARNKLLQKQPDRMGNTRKNVYLGNNLIISRLKATVSTKNDITRETHTSVIVLIPTFRALKRKSISAPFFRVPKGGFITTVSTTWPKQTKILIVKINLNT